MWLLYGAFIQKCIQWSACHMAVNILKYCFFIFPTKINCPVCKLSGKMTRISMEGLAEFKTEWLSFIVNVNVFLKNWKVVIVIFFVCLFVLMDIHMLCKFFKWMPFIFLWFVGTANLFIHRMMVIVCREFFKLCCECKLQNSLIFND